MSSPQSLITFYGECPRSHNRFAMEIPLKRRKDDLKLEQSTNHFWGKLNRCRLQTFGFYAYHRISIAKQELEYLHGVTYIVFKSLQNSGNYVITNT